MRSEFEKLSNIKCFINIFEFDEVTNEYKYKNRKNIGDHTLGFVNGAWYAFQEQQKKLGAVKSKLSNIYDACDDNTAVALLLDEIQELLK